MYKVFFNEKTVLLTDDFIRNFRVKDGLFYKYSNIDELEELLSLFWEIKRFHTLFIYHHDLDQLIELFKSCFKLIYAGGGLIRNSQGRYLVMKRRGKWDLPKGKVNKGETIEAAAIMEATEETGLTGLVVISPMLSTYHTYYIEEKPVLKRTTWFEMLYPGHDDPVPEIDEDITEIVWVRKEEIPSLVENTYLSIADVFRYANLLKIAP